ncbi:16935_t:CDS:2, partial [Acaulospora colombiana]
ASSNSSRTYLKEKVSTILTLLSTKNFVSKASVEKSSAVANRSYYRAYVGPLTDDVDKDSLKTILETAFGTVETLDFIPGK